MAGLDLKARIAAAQAAKDAAEGALSDDDKQEQADRAALAKLQEETRVAEKAKRDLDLARRLDLARDLLGPDASLDVFDGEEKTPGAGTYVLKAPPAKVIAAWQKGMGDPKVDRTAAGIDFAGACVHDFNGSTDLHSLSSVAGGEMLATWKRLGFLPTTISNIGSELGGLVLDARKS